MKVHPPCELRRWSTARPFGTAGSTAPRIRARLRVARRTAAPTFSDTCAVTVGLTTCTELRVSARKWVAENSAGMKIRKRP